MNKTIQCFLLILLVLSMTNCSFNSKSNSSHIEKANKYKYAIIRYDIKNVASWSADNIGVLAPEEFRPLNYGKMREITTSDPVFISNLEESINKRHFKLKGNDNIGYVWMMVRLYGYKSEIIDTLAISDQYGWFNHDVFRDSELVKIVGNKIFEHDTEWKRKVMEERFYVNGKWRTYSDVFWDILTGKFTKVANIEMSNPQND